VNEIMQLQYLAEAGIDQNLALNVQGQPTLIQIRIGPILNVVKEAALPCHAAPLLREVEPGG
jgi:hypothetical protein